MAEENQSLTPYDVKRLTDEKAELISALKVARTMIAFLNPVLLDNGPDTKQWVIDLALIDCLLRKHMGLDAAAVEHRRKRMAEGKPV